MIHGDLVAELLNEGRMRAIRDRYESEAVGVRDAHRGEHDVALATVEVTLDSASVEVGRGSRSGLPEST